MGGVRTVVLAGFATDMCVLFTAAEAHMRDYRVVLPTDCVGARNVRNHREAVRRMVNDLNVRATTLERLRLSR
jgi:nicotinamidase-related amidase